MTRLRLALVLLLAAAGAAASGLLLLHHHGEGSTVALVEQVCGEGQASGCEAVSRSPYAEVAGLSLAALGLFFYLSLLVLLTLSAVSGPEARGTAAWLALVLLALALVVDLALLALQAFAIRAFCRLCLLTYLLNIVAFAVLWPARRSRGSFRAALAAAEGRLLAAGWALGSAAFAVAVVAAEATLDHREAQRVASILGSQASPPAPPTGPAPASVAPPAPLPASAAASPSASSELERHREEARLAQEEARLLRETLEDPSKLEKYLDEKAARDFDAAPRQQVDLRQVPFKGPAEAPIRVVAYSDFLCPFCRSLAGAFDNYLPRSGNRVGIYFKNFPLDKSCNPTLESTVHPGACWLALGAVCAQAQGRFWAYHDHVFSADVKEPKGHEVVKLGVEAGLDQSALETCMVSDRTKQRLAVEIAEARRAGVRATPTVFVNGKRLPRINDFLQAVEKEARRLGLAPKAGSGAR